MVYRQLGMCYNYRGTMSLNSCCRMNNRLGIHNFEVVGRVASKSSVGLNPKLVSSIEPFVSLKTCALPVKLK